MTSGQSDHASSESVINPELLGLLVCPVDHAELRLDGTTLVCTRCGRVYPIEDGIPNMLVEDEA